MRQTGGWYFGSPDSKTLTGGATARTPANALDVTVQRPQHTHARVGGPAADLKRWGLFWHGISDGPPVSLHTRIS